MITAILLFWIGTQLGVSPWFYVLCGLVFAIQLVRFFNEIADK